MVGTSAIVRPDMMVLMYEKLCKQILIFETVTACGLGSNVTVSEWERYPQTLMSVL